MTLARRFYLLATRALQPVLLLGVRVYSHITGNPRARIVVFNEYGEVLLLKNVLSHDGKWVVPGGGVKRGEPWVAGAQRELHEETGIDKPLESFRPLGSVSQQAVKNMHFTAVVFALILKKDELPQELHNPREIVCTGWFLPDTLPDDTNELVPLLLERAKQG